ncbi:MAG: crossover junction endodeoxyribonuclease RuvC [Alphaproteobacteria bacterium]|nr:crossover junction endodeoxyribonuclease RuvC [Alphaproteobacteria bacterium]
MTAPAASPVTILGIDPGLRHTGWGIIAVSGNHLSFIAGGCISPRESAPVAERLAAIADALDAVIAAHGPDEAAVEQTFVNNNAASALKLGQARGIALLCPARAGVHVHEYAANLIKKSVTGYGHADKSQIEVMIKLLLPGAGVETSDAADALAIAICHAHHRTATNLIARVAGAGR